MNTIFKVRPLAAIVLCLFAGGAPAQQTEPAAPETPPPAEAAPAAVATEAAEPAEGAPAPAEAAAAPVEAAPAAGHVTTTTSAAKKLVILPVEFIVYQRSVAGLEAVPDWTETAKFALGDAAAQRLRDVGRFEIMPLPELDGEAKGLLREHVEFFKLIASNVSILKTFGGKAWQPKWDNFDYTLGDGLGFLAEASGADYAFILGGLQIAQTGGQAFMQFMFGGAGGGTFITAGIVDLRDGTIRWFNYKEGMQMFGMTGTDVRKPETAAEMVANMFVGFPAVQVVRLPPF